MARKKLEPPYIELTPPQAKIVERMRAGWFWHRRCACPFCRVGMVGPVVTHTNGQKWTPTDQPNHGTVKALVRKGILKERPNWKDGYEFTALGKIFTWRSVNRVRDLVILSYVNGPAFFAA